MDEQPLLAGMERNARSAPTTVLVLRGFASEIHRIFTDACIKSEI
jgi:hypothetical protein